MAPFQTRELQRKSGGLISYGISSSVDVRYKGNHTSDSIGKVPTFLTTFRAPLSHFGWGAVLRNHSGAFVLCAREGLEVFPTPELAEALAVRRALMVAKDHGVKRVALVSDCLSLIQRITFRIQDRSSAGSVIGDIKSLATDFESCFFSFYSRTSNVIAHKLTRSIESSVCNISVGVIPELIREELCNDVS
jgi:hypothetical protein